MRALLLLPTLALLTACGQAPPAGPAPRDLPSPTAVPASEHQVRTRGLVTVMDTGKGPELCLGPVAESYPPQCSGPAITGWSWEEHRVGRHTSGKVQWGEYALVGTWSGSGFGVQSAVPAALYDVAAPEPTQTAPGPGGFDPAVMNDELRHLPGYLSSHDTEGRMHVEVMYDDGSIQAWVDQEYGAGVVVVNSALVDVPS